MSQIPLASLEPLRDFVRAATDIVESRPDEAALLARLKPELERLIAGDGWLPAPFAVAGETGYRQYLLHCDPLERFSVVSFVWGPGQKTPIHDHRVWGLVGVLRGEELSTAFERGPDGALRAGEQERVRAGEVVAVSPAIGDIHAIANGIDEGASISIHVYGANIGAVRRATFDPATGAEKLFISGYSNDLVPNLWRYDTAA